MINKILYGLIALMCIFSVRDINAQLTEVLDFGPNPGNLDMFLFEPSAPEPSAGVVLVLHGCGQQAANFADQTGWSVLADTYGFYVVYAQQRSINNPTRCFNWFRSTDNQRDLGEAASLAQMVQFVHDNYETDSSRSFVCGLSAGGAMTPVMLACYPDVFRAGGAWAGVPYLYEPGGTNSDSPQEWGDKVRNAYTEYTGEYPSLFICQGDADSVTDPINAQRLITQWTNLHDLDQTSSSIVDPVGGNDRLASQLFLNNTNDTICQAYFIEDMGHGIAVDPGNDVPQGGQTGAGAFDVDFYSTYWMGRFFGLIPAPQSSVNSIQDASNVHVYVDEDGTLVVANQDQTQFVQVKVINGNGRQLLTEYVAGGSNRSMNLPAGAGMKIVYITNSTGLIYVNRFFTF